jgi:hypothetical protein
MQSAGTVARMRAVHVDLASIPDAMEMDGDLVHPHWERIFQWVDGNLAEPDWHDAYVQIGRQWLEGLARQLGAEYMVYESPVLFLMTVETEAQAVAWIRHAERTLAHIAKFLPRLVEGPIYGKRVALMLRDDDDYYRYISHAYPDGEYASSAGCCILQGYCHVVVRTAARWSVAETMTHELAHASFFQLSLPLWIEEGVVQIIERAIHPSHALPMTRELRQRHRDQWSNVSLDDFWTGASFHDPKSQELSYSLAYVLASNFLGTRRTDFQQFLLDARQDDHGAGAIQQHYGISLVDCVCAFLGEGPWITRD